MENRSEISKIQAFTKVDKIQIEFCWRIEQFSFCIKKQDILESSTFGTELKWRVRLYTKGINEKYSRYIGIFLVLVQDMHPVKRNLPREVFYSFSILNAENQRVNMVRSHESREFQKQSDCWGFPKFLARSLIETDRNELVPNDQLTILVEMTIFGNISTVEKKDFKPEPILNVQPDYKDRLKDPALIEQEQDSTKTPTTKIQIETVLKKQKDFANFLLNSKYSDMQLISSDGNEFPVHRILLSSESSVFQHKFDSNEKLNRLELKHFDSQTLNDILRNLNFKSSYETLLHFVDVFQMNDLKNYFEQKLIDKLSLTNAVNYLKIAHQCSASNLKSKVINLLKTNLYRVNDTDDWKRLLETDPQLTSDVYRQILIDK